MDLYLAGPMSGYDDHNRPAFEDAAWFLRDAGHTVLCPTELDKSPAEEAGEYEWSWYLRRDLAAFLDPASGVEAVVVLPGWRESRGALLEARTATALSIPIYEYDHRAEDGIGERVTVIAATMPPERRVAEHDVDGGEVRVTDPSTGGAKGRKLARFDLIPADVLWELAEHYGRGEVKYPSDEAGLPNWMRGMRWSLLVGALERHLKAWLQGEELDEETGSHHLVAVAWHAIGLRWFARHGRGTDDRLLALAQCVPHDPTSLDTNRE